MVLIIQLHLQIFMAFFRVGMLGYGGGPSSIPLVHKEVVEKYKWFNNDEFTDILALGNALPGPIATKMAAYIGYRVHGVPGAINAVVATIVPTILIMIVLLTFLAAYKDQPWVQGMTRGIAPVIGIMLLVLGYEFIKNSFSSLGRIKSIVLFAVSLILLGILGVHEGIFIAVLLFYVLLKPVKPARSDQKPIEGRRGNHS